MDIIEKINLHIKEKRMTQTAIAEQSGINRPHLSRILNGRFSPNTETLSKILNVIGLQLDVKEVELEDIKHLSRKVVLSNAVRKAPARRFQSLKKEDEPAWDNTSFL
jgi:transcriptional regulator with XRE-family HTH domain